MDEKYNVIGTRHYKERAKERGGWNEKQAQKILNAAIERGITYEKCKCSSDRRFLLNRTSDQTIGIAYNGYCFVIDKEMTQCITVIELPKDFGRRKRNFLKSKLRDPKYIRRNALAMC